MIGTLLALNLAGWTRVISALGDDETAAGRYHRIVAVGAEKHGGRLVEAVADNALALLERLIPFHSFLVQRTAERWIVHAQAPGCPGEPLADARHAIEEWRSERSLDAPVRVGGRPKGRPQ